MSESDKMAAVARPLGRTVLTPLFHVHSGKELRGVGVSISDVDYD